MANTTVFSLNNSVAAREVCVMDDGTYAYLGVGTLNPTHPFEVAVGGTVVYSIDTTGTVASTLPATKGYAYTGTVPAIKAGTGTSAGTFWTVTTPAGGASSTAAGGAGASIIYTTGGAGASISGGGVGGDYTINLGAGTGTGRSGYFIVNAGSTGPFDPLSVNGWAQFNATIIAADASQGRSVVSNVLASGLTADYAGQTSAIDGAFTTDTSAFNYTGIIRGTMGHVYIQTTGTATVAFAEGVAGVVQINAGAAGTLTAGYGTAGELVANATGYTVSAFNGVQGVVNAAGATNITTANGVYGKAATVASSGGVFGLPIGGYFLAQQNDSTTITTAKGAEIVVNNNSAALGGAITNSWVTHSHYDSQTTATGIATNVIVHNIVVNHAAPTTITLAIGAQFQVNQTSANAAGIITTSEAIRIVGGTINNSVPGVRGIRIQNMGNSKVSTSEAIRIEAQSGSSANNYALNVLGGTTAITPTMTVASATSAVWDGISVPATTLTLSGTTAITTATGVNLVTINAPTISWASNTAITNASTFTILGAPIAGGAGPAILTNAMALWVQAGVSRLDGQTITSRAVHKVEVNNGLLSTSSAQSITLTAAILIGGFLDHTVTTGAATDTLDNGTNISAAVPGAAVGDSFVFVINNSSASAFAITLAGATGATLKGSATTVGQNKSASLTFVNTGATTWNVYVSVSA